MTNEKRGRGRPPKAKQKLEVATALEPSKRKRQTKLLIDAVRKKSSKLDGSVIEDENGSLIEVENRIKWLYSFKDLIEKNPDITQIIDKNPEIALLYELHKRYAGISPLMEEMLNAGMRKGIESILGKRKSKEKQDEISARTQKIHNRIVEKYIEICTNKGGYPGNGYRALILKKINSEFGKNTLTDPAYINKILSDARKNGKLDPNIGKKTKVLQKNTSRK